MEEFNTDVLWNSNDQYQKLFRSVPKNGLVKIYVIGG
jgi:hypothetical protein